MQCFQVTIIVEFLEGEYPALIFCYLSRAFNWVNHNKLTQSWKTMYQRSDKSNIDQLATSEPKYIKLEVPRGSILRPILSFSLVY